MQQWDADNRAVGMTNTTTGGRVAFVYDGDGRPLCRTLRVLPRLRRVAQGRS